jgi:hypothetical protein
MTMSNGSMTTTLSSMACDRKYTPTLDGADTADAPPAPPSTSRAPSGVPFARMLRCYCTRDTLSLLTATASAPLQRGHRAPCTAPCSRASRSLGWPSSPHARPSSGTAAPSCHHLCSGSTSRSPRRASPFLRCGLGSCSSKARARRGAFDVGRALSASAAQSAERVGYSLTSRRRHPTATRPP